MWYRVLYSSFGLKMDLVLAGVLASVIKQGTGEVRHGTSERAEVARAGGSRRPHELWWQRAEARDSL